MKLELEDLDLFEELAEKFRFNIVKNLKDCLKNTNLSEADKETICGEFLSEFCVDLDQGQWEHSEKYYRPIVGFINSKNNTLQSFDDNAKLIAPYEAYQHHESVWGEIEEFYEKS